MLQFNIKQQSLHGLFRGIALPYEEALIGASQPNKELCLFF